MKASEIYRKMTPTEKLHYDGERKAQGRRIGEVIFPLMPLSVLFVFLGWFEVYASLLFLLLCVLALARLPKTVRCIRQENREWLSRTEFARSNGVSSRDIQL